ncbi:MAG: hypothetical protein M5U34_02390 [Chloroflexi bacterium]|nr:hypothetical protein [Chloroflexota bacterium]
MMGAGPILLEPIYKVTVTAPADYMGDYHGRYELRRARVLGIDQEGTKSIVQAEAPLAEMQTYAQDLRSMTQGRGVYSMEFSNYGRVPSTCKNKLRPKLPESRREEWH